MASDPHAISEPELSSGPDEVEMPRPTIAPLTLSLGLAMLAVGVITSPAFLVVGAGIIIAGLGLWIANLLPGRGHVHEPLVPRAQRPATVSGRPSTVEHLQVGHAWLPPTVADGGSPDLGRGMGRNRRRPGDAHTGPGLRALERPRYLVSGESAGGHGLARRRSDDRCRAGAISPVALAAGESSFMPSCRWYSA